MGGRPTRIIKNKWCRDAGFTTHRHGVVSQRFPASVFSDVSVFCQNVAFLYCSGVAYVVFVSQEKRPGSIRTSFRDAPHNPTHKVDVCRVSLFC